MIKTNIIKTEKKHLPTLYHHLSVQSLLDIKAVNGEVTEGVLYGMLNSSSKSFTVLYGDKIAYTVFVMPTDENEYSIYVVSTTIGYSEIEALNETFSAIFRDLSEGNFYSIVYKGNHKYAKLLKNNGFRFIKNLIHGEEKRNFLLLGRLLNDK